MLGINVAASGRFTIVPATARRAAVSDQALLLLDQLQVLSAGDQLQVSLAGFPVGSGVYLTLYGPGMSSTAPGQTNFPLLLDLPSVTANANGDALVRWRVPPGTSNGDYAIWISPQLSGCAHQSCLSFRINS
jgi:hypothetical protein